MTKNRYVMKHIAPIMTVALAIVMLTGFDTLAQQQSAHVASQGGGISSGGAYTQFAVAGGEPVASDISGGSYSGQAGFLFRNFLTFIPSYTVSGNVVSPEGNPVSEGTISLIKDDKGTKTQLAKVALNAQGSFSFPDIEEGKYTLKVTPAQNSSETPALLTTYLGGTQTPADAQLFELTEDKVFANLQVLREAAPEQEWTGNSSVSGVLVEEEGSGNAGGRLLSGLRTKAGTPMADAQVFLTDPETKDIKFSKVTDSEGRFRFDNIASRQYGFLVEYEGETFEMAETIDITEGNTTAEVTAVVSDGGMKTTVEQVVTGVEEEVLAHGFVLYPNPVKDKLQIKITGLKPGPLEIHVFDRQGRSLMVKKMTLAGESLEDAIDFSELPHGLYLVSIRQSDYLLHRKIIKQ